MAFSEEALGQEQLGIGVTTVFTVPASTTTVVRNILICNTKGADITVNVWIDQDGTGATDAEAILKSFTILANDFLNMKDLWIVMEAASTLKAQASVTTACCITVSGANIT